MAVDHHGNLEDMDIIFAGGGTAACIAAGRLAKANPELKILLIEGGANNFNNPTVTNPALYLSHLAPDSQTALECFGEFKFYKGSKSEHLNGREPIVPMGGILGGGSSINFMMYTRAQGVDFDSWNTPGWTAKDMLPLCNKLETFHQDEEGIDRAKHGYEGPIHVSDGGFRNENSESQVMDTIKKMGYKEIVDLQDLDQVNGFSRWQRYVSKDGKRQDTAHCYIHPLLQDGQHPNLHLLVQTKVVRVIFDDSTPPRAIGVEYKPNASHQPALTLSKPVHHVVKAKKLVVVSAGALGTPQILERSGVGSADVLKKLDIRVISDLPGVGENYQDHHLLLYPYKTSLEPEQTLDALLSGRKNVEQAMTNKDPMLGWNAIDICSKLRPTEEEAQALGPDFWSAYQRDFVSSPTRPLLLCGVVNTFLADPSLVAPGQYTTMGVYTAYPYSRGRIHITSSTDVLNGYDFDTGFLSDPSDLDLKTQVWAYKISREIARRLPYYQGELELGHPKFSSDSGAALIDLSPSSDTDNPEAITSSSSSIKSNISSSSSSSSLPKNHNHQPSPSLPLTNLVYAESDDRQIESWIRSNLSTTWHSLGTCAMKPRSDGGVVDGDLNVYGTRSLKVADLSMVPENVGANTNNTALVVGEKAAVIIGRELGIEV